MKLAFVTPHKCTRGKVIGRVCLLLFLPVCWKKINASSPDPGCSISAKYLKILLFELASMGMSIDYTQIPGHVLNVR